MKQINTITGTSPEYNELQKVTETEYKRNQTIVKLMFVFGSITLF